MQSDKNAEDLTERAGWDQPGRTETLLDHGISDAS